MKLRKIKNKHTYFIHDFPTIYCISLHIYDLYDLFKMLLNLNF